MATAKTTLGKVLFKIELSRVGDKAIVTFRSGLEMRCTCPTGSGPWCKHRADVIAERLDAPYLHDWFREYEDGADVLVPILPSKEVFAPIYLRKIGEDAIGVEDPNHRMSSDEIFYGTLGPDDGLSDIRMMVADYIDRKLVTDGVKLLPCARDNKHTPKARRAMALLAAAGEDATQMQQYRLDAFTHNATVFFNRLCQTCGAAENYDDMIPEGVF